MRRCQICHHHFKPVQTFETLFKFPTICPTCGLFLELPLKDIVLPLEKNELIVHSFEASAHPALFHLMMHHLSKETKEGLILHEKKALPKDAWPLLSALFKPLRIYAYRRLTLDEIEEMLD